MVEVRLRSPAPHSPSRSSAARVLPGWPAQTTPPPIFSPARAPIRVIAFAFQRSGIRQQGRHGRHEYGRHLASSPGRIGSARLPARRTRASTSPSHRRRPRASARRRPPTPSARPPATATRTQRTPRSWCARTRCRPRHHRRLLAADLRERGRMPVPAPDRSRSPDRPHPARAAGSRSAAHRPPQHRLDPFALGVSAVRQACAVSWSSARRAAPPAHRRLRPPPHRPAMARRTHRPHDVIAQRLGIPVGVVRRRSPRPSANSSYRTKEWGCRRTRNGVPVRASRRRGRA